jgi:outer membrane receptor protein involved in Fe transport
MLHVVLRCLLVAAFLAGAASASGQGTQTGTLSGTVKDPDDLVVPGVTVTVTSPALQGVRTAVTDGNGNYSIPGLPPGTYEVEFQLQGMATITHRDAIVPLGGVATIDATMRIATLTEVVQVVAERSNVVTSPTAVTNLRSEEVASLPIGRTPFRLAETAPGVTDNTPNVGQVTISGAFAYDNVFMIDGVDVNDNLFGTAHNVFIEDAIEETQVLTSGISAEYGRFSGGVINLVTKRGGNNFSGGFRVNLTNPAWSKETPLEVSRGTNRVDDISTFYEGTLGGPFLRDRLWFFTAGRRERSEVQRAFQQIGSPYITGTENDRFEIKLTGTVAPTHTLQGSFVNNKTVDIDRPSIAAERSITSSTLVTRQLPNKLFVLNYNGPVLTRFYVTGQYSEKRFGFRNTGGTDPNILASPFLTRGVLGVPGGLHYNAPYFSSNDPEDRNNRQLTASASYFLTTADAGSHDFKFGFENYTSSRTGGNSQSATGYVFQTDYVTTSSGLPALDGQGRVIPRFVSSPTLGASPTRVQNWLAVQGAQIDIRTLSLYLQDRWRFNPRLTLDLGVRFEDVRSDATGDIVGADTRSFVPRLAATFDPRGNGRTIVQATYAHYAGKFAETQFARNTNVGTPSLLLLEYTGPEGAGADFAPGFNLANYRVIGGNFPTANVFFEEGTSSPITKEFTASLGQEFGRGYVKGIYTWRNTTKFFEDFINDPTAAGKTTVVREGINFGVFDNVVYGNSDDPARRYQALQFIGRFNVRRNLILNGSYTAQLKNEGNFEGEAGNQPGNTSAIADYPELYVAERNFPVGRLDDFQRHKIRLYAIYNQTLGRFGSIDISPFWRYNSAQTFSLAATGQPFSAVQLARNPGYARAAGTSTTVFFGGRGTEEFEGYGLVDLAVSYQIPVWKTLRPWIKFEMFNVLNNDKLIGWTTTVTPDPASPLDENGLRTGFVRASNFGQARSNADYPRPLPGLDGLRTFQMAFGLRF